MTEQEIIASAVTSVLQNQPSDPAWFYSSLAQSSAAIVGLIGAVLGSRIIEHLTLIRNEKEKLYSIYILPMLQHFNSINRNLEEYKEYCESEIIIDQEYIDRQQAIRVLKGYRKWGMSTSEIKDVNPEEHKIDLERDLEDVNILVDFSFQLQGVLGENELKEKIKLLKALQGQMTSPCFKSKIKHDSRVLESLLDPIREFKSKLLPQSFFIVFVILAWMSLAGILWPLSMLAANMHKTAMIIGLGIGIFGILGYFIYQLFEINKIGSDFGKK